MEKKRRGKFYIPIVEIDKQSDFIKKIMEHVIIYRAEMLYDRNSIEYYALSRLFSPIEQCEEAPEYFFIVDPYTHEVRADFQPRG